MPQITNYTKELYQSEKNYTGLNTKKEFTRKEREGAIAYLINLANTLNNKEKYQLMNIMIIITLE